MEWDKPIAIALFALALYVCGANVHVDIEPACRGRVHAMHVIAKSARSRPFESWMCAEIAWMPAVHIALPCASLHRVDRAMWTISLAERL
ncbi:hypothetical protein [Cognatilysobacter bugurensis]|uniref:Uncharacterized protein n=1 Tax=Cognatilysobacter bugurensis TaxID=543356 RepID=A0A918SZL4_9GAMM|nr:hypothetical protein [Lysobacter bugurensis]GHA79385.1 hypothetical protein GCM10007067_16110 [Lysobacter bugurensis]